MSNPKKRETVLTVWLVLMLVVNIAVIFFYAFFAASPDFGSLLFFRFPYWSVYVFCAFGAVNIVSVCFLFLWKKWAFYVLCGTAAVTLAINLYIGIGVQAFLGLGEVVITYLVLRQQWSLFDDF